MSEVPLYDEQVCQIWNVPAADCAGGTRGGKGGGGVSGECAVVPRRARI